MFWNHPAMATLGWLGWGPRWMVLRSRQRGLHIHHNSAQASKEKPQRCTTQRKAKGQQARAWQKEEDTAQCEETDDMPNPTQIMWQAVVYSGHGKTSKCWRWCWHHREGPWKQSGVSVLRTGVVRQGVSQRARKCEPGGNARLAPATDLHLLVLERLHALVQGKLDAAIGLNRR